MEGDSVLLGATGCFQSAVEGDLSLESWRESASDVSDDCHAGGVGGGVGPVGRSEGGVEGGGYSGGEGGGSGGDD